MDKSSSSNMGRDEPIKLERYRTFMNQTSPSYLEPNQHIKPEQDSSTNELGKLVDTKHTITPSVISTSHCTPTGCVPQFGYHFGHGKHQVLFPGWSPHPTALSCWGHDGESVRPFCMKFNGDSFWKFDDGPSYLILNDEDKSYVSHPPPPPHSTAADRLSMVYGRGCLHVSKWGFSGLDELLSVFQRAHPESLSDERIETLRVSIAVRIREVWESIVPKERRQMDNLMRGLVCDVKCFLPRDWNVRMRVRIEDEMEDSKENIKKNKIAQTKRARLGVKPMCKYTDQRLLT